jgi:hypothetical protein
VKVANATSVHCVGRWCVGITDDMIRSSDLDRIAAAQVIGQTVVTLMLGELIRDDIPFDDAAMAAVYCA